MTLATPTSLPPDQAPGPTRPATLLQPFRLFRLIFFLSLHGPSPVFIVIVTLLYIGFIFSYSAVSNSCAHPRCPPLFARAVATNVAGVNAPRVEVGFGLGFGVGVYARCLLRIIVVTICTYFINSTRLLISAGNLFRFALLIRAFYCIYWFLFVKLDFQLHSRLFVRFAAFAAILNR